MSKRYILWSAAIAAAVTFLLIMIGHSQQGKMEDLVAATVNGEPISTFELKHRMSLSRAETLLHFQTMYGVQETSDFWTSTFNGEVPLELMKKEAMDKAVRVKLQQILARDYGLTEDITYSAFHKGFILENKRRKAALQAKEVIYGPVEYTEEAYFEYVFTNQTARLKEEMIGKGISFTEADLKEFYNESKDLSFQKEEEIVIEKIAISYVDKDGWISESMRQEAEVRIIQAMERLGQEEEFGKLAEEYNTSETERRTHGRQKFDSSTARVDAKYNAKLYKEVIKLEAGQISGILELDNTFYLIKCLEKKNDGYQTFEDVKDNIDIEFVNQKYEEYIDDLVRKVKVTINESAIDKL